MRNDQPQQSAKLSISLIDIHVGSRISELREAARMSRASLAACLEVPAAVIGDWEDGTERVPPPYLVTMTGVFSCSLTAFFEGLLDDDQRDLGGTVIL